LKRLKKYPEAESEMAGMLELSDEIFKTTMIIL
jgi:hypothetical protein